MLFSFSCHAQTPLSAQELQAIDFGVFPSDIKRCLISASGVLRGGCVGTGQLGEIGVKGEPYMSYGASITSHTWEGDARLVPRIANESTLVLDAKGQGVIQVHGVLSLKNSASFPGGKIKTTYTITVYYQ